MKALGIIFSNSHEVNLPELTSDRAMGAVPFGGRFRMIDLVLSPMSNCGISKAAVIAERNYHSLVRHLGAGKEWDLVRKNSGLTIYTPFGNAEQKGVSSSRVEALSALLRYLREAQEELVVLADCDTVSNFAYDNMLEQHLASGADVTLAYVTGNALSPAYNPRKTDKELIIDQGGRVSEIRGLTGTRQDKNLLTHTWVMGRELLISLIGDGIARGHQSFSRDILGARLTELKVFAYRYQGFCGQLDSLAAYLQYNLAFLAKDKMAEVFGDPARPVYTHVKDSPPTIYGDSAEVKNSLIASGCRIEGRVENSVLFRGVTVARGAVVRNSVLMSEGFAATGADIAFVVADKSVTVSGKRPLYGSEQLPYYIPRNLRI